MNFRFLQVLLLVPCLSLQACKTKNHSTTNQTIPQAPSAPTNKVGYFQSPFGTTKVYYTPQGDYGLVGGDLMLPLKAISSNPPNAGFYAVGVNNVGFLWPNGRIPYQINISDSDFDSLLKQGGSCPLDQWQSTADFQRALQQAMADWQTNPDGNPTGIHFVPATSADLDYVVIHAATNRGMPGWSTFIGRSGGVQDIYYTSACTYCNGCLTHELGHAIGFFHEHSRSDRDQYITVLWQNIPDSSKSQFLTTTTPSSQLLTAYDYSSVMHYCSECDGVYFHTFLEGNVYRPSFTKKDGSLVPVNTKISALDYQGLQSLVTYTQKFFKDPSQLTLSQIQFDYTTMSLSYTISDPSALVEYSLSYGTAGDGSEVPASASQWPGVAQASPIALDYLVGGYYQVTLTPCYSFVLAMNQSSPCGTSQTITITPAFGLNSQATNLQIHTLQQQMQATKDGVLNLVQNFASSLSACVWADNMPDANYVITQLNASGISIDPSLLIAAFAQPTGPVRNNGLSLAGGFWERMFGRDEATVARKPTAFQKLKAAVMTHKAATAAVALLVGGGAAVGALAIEDAIVLNRGCKACSSTPPPPEFCADVDTQKQYFVQQLQALSSTYAGLQAQLNAVPH